MITNNFKINKTNPKTFNSGQFTINSPEYGALDNYYSQQDNDAYEMFYNGTSEQSHNNSEQDTNQLLKDLNNWEGISATRVNYKGNPTSLLRIYDKKSGQEKYLDAYYIKNMLVDRSTHISEPSLADKVITLFRGNSVYDSKQPATISNYNPYQLSNFERNTGRNYAREYNQNQENMWKQNAGQEILNLTMPSNYFGATYDKFINGRNFFNGVINGSGIFSDNTYQNNENAKGLMDLTNIAVDLTSFKGAGKLKNFAQQYQFKFPTGRLYSGLPIPEITKKWQLENLPGYHIRSLAKESNLSKQVSKQGTISLKNVEAWANKSDIAAIDREILRKILENHKGETYIDYNTLRKEAQEQIPQYNRVPQTAYQDYGMERLGFGPLNDSSRTSNQLAQNPAFNERYYITDNPLTGDPQFYRREFPFDEVPISEIEEFVNNNIPSEAPYKLNTFTFESPGITGNTKHYQGNPIGHSRTFTISENPDVLYVMESQSDWAQNKPLELFKTHDIKSLQDLDEEIAFQEANAGEGFVGKDWKETLNDLRKSREFIDPVGKHMSDTYLSRQIQENLRYAAENGQTKMRYPTSETAAKIEGYRQQETSSINELFDEQMTEYNKGREQLAEQFFDKYINRLKKYKYDDVADVVQRGRQHFIEYEELPQDVGEELESQGFIDKITNDKSFNLNELDNEFIDAKRKYELEHPAPNKYIYTKEYRPEHQTILKKYSDFPKQYQKLFGKNTEIRIVKDSKGNTWYEVDVPKDMLTRELLFKKGGVFNLNKTLRQIFI